MDEELKQEFNALTLPYLASLYRFALLLANENDQAEDLVHDTYLRAYRYYNRFEPGTNYKAWLFTMMRNIFFNANRKRAREISSRICFSKVMGADTNLQRAPHSLSTLCWKKGSFKPIFKKP